MKHQWKNIINDEYLFKRCERCWYVVLRKKANNCGLYPNCKFTETVYKLRPYDKCEGCGKIRVKRDSKFIYPNSLLNIEWYYK